jgi:hypothetical protein
MLNKEVCVKCRDSLYKKGLHQCHWVVESEKRWDFDERIICPHGGDTIEEISIYKLPQKCPYKLEHILKEN